MEHSRPPTPEGGPPAKRVRPLDTPFANVDHFFAHSDSSSDDSEDVHALLEEGYASDESTQSARIVMRELFPDALQTPVSVDAVNAAASADTVESLAGRAITYPCWNKGMLTVDVDRLQTMLDIVDPARNRYTLANIPADTAWKNNMLGDDERGFNVLAIGVLTDTMFTASRHSVFQRSWVTLHLLRDLDRRGLRRIHEAAKPYRKRSTLYLRAIYEPPAQNATVHFPYVYDATRTYTCNARMPRLDIGDLVIGDIVVVEGYVAREKLRSSRTGEWESWGTEFRMRSISRLFPRPRPIEHVWKTEREQPAEDVSAE